MKHYLGIDIGGTAVKLGIVDEAGAVLAKAEESVSFDGYRTPILTTVLKAAQAFLAAQSVPAESLAGIGVSATGQIDSRKGIVAGTCGNLPNYIGAPIKAELEKTFGLPVTVANDANCMTLGEVWVGGAQGYTDVIGVTLELYDQLEKGNLDIIFLADRPAYHPTLKTVFSRPVAVPFIASAEHPLANQKNVPPERLTEETILLTEKNNNYRQIFDELAIQHGASFHHTQEISSFAIILHFLQKKMGISFLPKYATLPILQEKNLALFTVAGFDIKMDLLIFYHRQKWVTPAMKYFTETAEEFFSPSAESET
jgi:hypothetical protein